jgi:hypothetical protein
MNPLRWVNVGALVVAGIGLFMAWATIGPFSVSGVDTDDGKLFGVILIVTGLFLLWWILQNSNKGAGILLMIGWAALVAMSIYEITNVSSKHYSVLGVSLSVGAGLYLNTIGSVAGIVTAAIDVSKSWDERSNQPVAGVLFVTGLVVVLGSIGAGVAGARNTSSTVSNPSNVSGSNGNSGALTNSGSTGNTGSLNSGSTGNNGSFNRGSTGNSGGFNSGSTGNSG